MKFEKLITLSCKEIFTAIAQCGQTKELVVDSDAEFNLISLFNKFEIYDIAHLTFRVVDDDAGENSVFSLVIEFSSGRGYLIFASSKNVGSFEAAQDIAETVFRPIIEKDLWDALYYDEEDGEIEPGDSVEYMFRCMQNIDALNMGKDVEDIAFNDAQIEVLSSLAGEKMY